MRAPLNYVSDAWEKGLVHEFRGALGIRMASPDQAIANLSGGNQQKVVLARWLALKPKILIVDEPTRGIDVAAKAEVHQLIARLAPRCIAVIVISSELPEVIALADRIVTLCEGRLTGEISRSDVSEERLMRLMTLRGFGARARMSPFRDMRAARQGARTRRRLPS